MVDYIIAVPSERVYQVLPSYCPDASGIGREVGAGANQDLEKESTILVPAVVQCTLGVASSKNHLRHWSFL